LIPRSRIAAENQNGFFASLAFRAFCALRACPAFVGMTNEDDSGVAIAWLAMTQRNPAL
jgi:hypothetical protein